MKKFIFTMTLSAVLALTGNYTLLAQKQEQEVKKYHLKIEKIENGKKVKLDTVVTSDEPFIWNGETVQPGRAMMFLSHDDASVKKFSYKTDEGNDANIMILKKGPEGTDSLEVIVKAGGDQPVYGWNSEDGHSWTFAPDQPGSDSHRLLIFREDENRNVIDLSDPDIISYKKKLMKDGTEKITIVRKQKQETKSSGEFIIKKDGKVYRINETEDGKKKEVEVEVELEKN